MNLNVVIVEDEKPAAQKLKKVLQTISSGIRILKILHDVKSAIQYFQAHPHPDLIFMDIELTDGISLEIFAQVELKAPVIFTTAYNEYWQHALSYNGIDYILKPVKTHQIEAALAKYEIIKRHFMGRFNELLQFIDSNRTVRFKEKFLIRRGNELVHIPADQVPYIYATDKVTCLVTQDGSKLILDDSLTQLEKELNPDHFIRGNRKYILNKAYIEKIELWPKGRLKIEIVPPTPDAVIISQENATRFKQWMEH